MLSILTQRLRNQRLLGPRLTTPAAVVDHLCAVQAQDPTGARWAVAQRTTDPSDAAVRAALDAGTIVRTHVLRPTWHYVMAGDVRWMLALTAPRIRNAAAAYYRQAGLTPTVFATCHAVIARALEGGRHLTRRDISAALARHGHVLEGQAIGHVMMQAELDALVCSGTSQGTQATYALLDERVQPSPPMSRDEALAALALRYFRSRGPALTADFAWWSGLTVGDAKAAIAMIAPQLEKHRVDGLEYWHTGETARPDAGHRASSSQLRRVHGRLPRPTPAVVLAAAVDGGAGERRRHRGAAGWHLEPRTRRRTPDDRNHTGPPCY